MNNIRIINASEGNLKNVSLEIPKEKLVVITGVSGSGKSTLLVDVLFNECQRQYLEAMSMQGIHKPDVKRIKGVSPAILISQTDTNRNPRSTVGTVTDIYTDLRMIYEKLGVRKCPYCGEIICSADCKEETLKVNKDYYVYMYCHKCNRKMEKLTCSHFSFNTKEGACPTCQGLGKSHTIDEEHVVDETLSIEKGAVLYWQKQYAKYQESILYKAYEYFHIEIPRKKAIQEFSDIQKDIFYHGVECNLVKEKYPDIQIPRLASDGRFEGVYPILWRRLSDKKGDLKQLNEYFKVTECPDCQGVRLNELSRSVTVYGTRLPELSSYSLDKLYVWIEDLNLALSSQHKQYINDYIVDIKTKIKRFLNVGLGYLSINRQIVTLSGGELQRLRLAAALDSELSGIIYILDEPTAGLHPKDTLGLIHILKRLRDLGNTVLVIEHDIDVIKAADYMIDIGPHSGKFGGEIIGQGTLEDIMLQVQSITRQYLFKPLSLKEDYRQFTNTIQIKHAQKYNLKDISVDIPINCLTTITGPSGSGKSTLIFEVLAKGIGVSGLEQFDQVIEIGQAPITKMKRSYVATYCDIYTNIRLLMANTTIAKEKGFSSTHFSLNTSKGRCEYCQGMGYVESHMLFFNNTNIICPVCGGNQFNEETLTIKYKGLSIKDILDLTIDEAVDVYYDNRKISKNLQLLQDVGLGYLQLGQSLTTLSGGERQRLKLAKQLIKGHHKQKNLYLMDEPTVGLHPLDIEHFITLLQHLVDYGHTIVVVEHNQQIIVNSDWIIDLGPEGGEQGGYVIFEGTPKMLKESTTSITAKYI